MRTNTPGSNTSTVTWLDADHHNTATATQDPVTGATTKRYYDPFGNSRGTPAADWPTNNGLLDKPQSKATGHSRFGIRDYDPTTGRFTTPDAVIDGNDPQQINGYNYANNNPILNADPTGGIYDPDRELRPQAKKAASDMYKQAARDFHKAKSKQAAQAKKKINDLGIGSLAYKYKSGKMSASKSIGSVKSTLSGKGSQMKAALTQASNAIKDHIRKSRSDPGAMIIGAVAGCILGSLAFGQCLAGVDVASAWDYDDKFSKSEWGTYFQARGYAAEGIIADALAIPNANRGVKVTADFDKTIGNTQDVRYVDTITETGVAIEVKVGSATLTTQMKNQIIKDLQLIGQQVSGGGPTVTAVTWVFVKSPEGYVADPATLAFLQEVGIDVVVID